MSEAAAEDETFRGDPRPTGARRACTGTRASTTA